MKKPEMQEITIKRNFELPEQERVDLLQEIKRGLDRSGIRAKLLAELDTDQGVRACPGCIACTCMIWI